MKKKNKCVAKKKKWLAKLYTLIISPLLSCPECSFLLLPRSMSAFMPAFVSTLVLALMPISVSCPRSVNVLSSYYILAQAAFAGFSSSCHTLISYYRIPTLLLLLSIFDFSLFLRSSTLGLFKQFLLDEPWLCVSTSLAKPLHLFLALNKDNMDNNNSLYNPTNNNVCKKGFDTTFINSHLVIGNHDKKKVNLSFASY